jgi:hypothetical protein
MLGQAWQLDSRNFLVQDFKVHADADSSKSGAMWFQHTDVPEAELLGCGVVVGLTWDSQSMHWRLPAVP